MQALQRHTCGHIKKPRGLTTPRCTRQRARHFSTALPQQRQPDPGSEQDVIAARKAKEQKFGVEDFSIAGVTFNGRQELVRQLQLNQILLLQREPWNEYDQHAVQVLDLAGRMLGYIPRKDKANELFTYESQFVLVASLGLARDSPNVGAHIYARPRVPSLLLDPLPAAEAARFADLRGTFGDRWPAAQAAIMAACNYKCELTGLSQGRVPVSFVPQWRYNTHSKAVQLARVVVMCEPLAAAKASLEQRLSALVDERAAGPVEAEKEELRSLAAGPAGHLFTEVNGLDESDAMQYFELVLRRYRTVVEQGWRFEVLLV